MTENNKKILIATGGTGGHIFPAVSLSNYLDKTGFISTLTTDNRGLKFIDNKFLQNTVVINSSSLDKQRKIISVLKIFIAIFKSLIFLFKKKPKFIFGMGGYASFPVCFAGIILRIPFVIYENNLLMGKANRFLAPFAKKILVSYKDIEGIDGKFKKKIMVIGNILREDILKRSKIKEKEIYDGLSILVLGGSQAAKIFAEMLPDIFIKCKKNNLNLKIYQQCLDEQKIDLQKKYETNRIDFELFSFTFDILKYYNLSNLVITRAGASALAELLNCNIPIISIPLDSSSENHQLKNAKYFMEKGFGTMIEEKYINNKLFNLLESVHKDKSMLDLIKKSQEKYSDKNVFKNITKVITELFYEN
tara:strand:+ start:4455 stop:5540 length:1086 start_codon:yes stop_codon:yes gene_type:complete